MQSVQQSAELRDAVCTCGFSAIAVPLVSRVHAVFFLASEMWEKIFIYLHYNSRPTVYSVSIIILLYYRVSNIYVLMHYYIHSTY